MVGDSTTVVWCSLSFGKVEGQQRGYDLTTAVRLWFFQARLQAVMMEALACLCLTKLCVVVW